MTHPEDSDPTAPGGTASTASAAQAPPAYDEVRVGDELPPVRMRVRRNELVRYAGASGDFNPIHYSPRAAAALQLPDVIAQGMLSMGQAAGVVSGWVVDPARIEEFSVRFANPVVVPDDTSEEGGVSVSYTGRVAEKLADGRVRIELAGSCGDEKILGAARAIVRL